MSSGKALKKCFFAKKTQSVIFMGDTAGVTFEEEYHDTYKKT
jgi:hypothetical protein